MADESVRHDGAVARFRIRTSQGEVEVVGPEAFVESKWKDVQSALHRVNENVVGPSFDKSLESPVERTAPRKRSKSSRPSGAVSRSKLGAAQYCDFHPIKLGISDEAERELLDFFGAKQPRGQEEQVAVLIYKMAKLLETDRVNYDQIYQGFRTVQQLPPPKSLKAVITNMANKMLVEREADGIRLKITGVDLVEKTLPRTSEKT